MPAFVRQIPVNTPSFAIAMVADRLLAVATSLESIGSIAAAQISRDNLVDVDFEDDVDTSEVYLSDVQYDFLTPKFVSGECGHLTDVDGMPFKFAYDAEEVRRHTKAWLDANVSQACEYVYSLTCETVYSGNINAMHMSPLQAGLVDPINLLEYERAFDMKDVIEQRGEDYQNGSGWAFGYKDILKLMEERGDIDADNVLDSAFYMMVSAIASVVADNIEAIADHEEEEEREAEAAEIHADNVRKWRRDQDSDYEGRCDSMSAAYHDDRDDD